MPVIASGGVGTLEHLREGVVEGRADAVLVASLFHFGQHTVAGGQALSARARRAGEARRCEPADELKLGRAAG